MSERDCCVIYASRSDRIKSGKHVAAGDGERCVLTTVSEGKISGNHISSPEMIDFRIRTVDTVARSGFRHDRCGCIRTRPTVPELGQRPPGAQIQDVLDDRINLTRDWGIGCNLLLAG